VIINTNVGSVFYYAREFDRAIEAERKALELDRNAAVTYTCLGLAYLQKRMYREAIFNLRKGVDLSPDVPKYLAELAYAYAAGGNAAPARRILAELESRSRRQYVPPYSLAVAYAGLGERGAALDCLEKAYEERDASLQTLKVTPLFDTLHSDPRFQDLLRRIGLPP
jgi:tetratricopeptide (TPR) repeat protein